MGDSKLFDAAKQTTEIVAAKASEVTRSVAGDTIRDTESGLDLEELVSQYVHGNVK